MISGAGVRTRLAAETGRPPLDAGVTVPRTNLVAAACTEQQTGRDDEAVDQPGAPVPVMPRAASFGSL